MNSLEKGIGAFAEYVGADAEMLLKVPDSMKIEDASTLGTGTGTAALGREYIVLLCPPEIDICV